MHVHARRRQVGGQKMATAAAVTASRAGRGIHSDGHKRQRKLCLEIVPCQDVIKGWDVSRQIVSAIGLQWTRKKLVLTAEHMFFCRSDQADHTVVDSLPMHEIDNIIPLSSTTLPSERKGAGSFSTKYQIIAVDRDPFELQEDDKDPDSVLVISTISDDYKAGRQTVISFGSKAERNAALTLLKNLIEQSKRKQDRIANPGLIHRAQRKARVLYESTLVQSTAILVIIGSFFASLVEGQINPGIDVSNCSNLQSSICQASVIFWWIETIFTFMFAAEVCLAMFALGIRDFFASASNLFDFTIVVLCIISVVISEFPHSGSLRMMRVLRIARVFTLIKRIQPLRIMLVALANSALPVVFVFLLLFLVLAVFSLIATELFREVDVCT